MAEIKNELSRIIEYHNTLLPECSRKHPAEIVSIIDSRSCIWFLRTSGLYGIIQIQKETP